MSKCEGLNVSAYISYIRIGAHDNGEGKNAAKVNGQ